MASTEQHPIFTKDPSAWMRSIGSVVEIISSDGCRHTGSVYTVDPVSESVVLATVPEDNSKKELDLKLILGHAIRSMTPIAEQGPVLKLDNLFKPQNQSNLSGADLKQHQERLRSWLLKNRLPVSVCKEDSSVLIVADILRVQAPYTAESCQCTNEIVLGRIQGLIKNMPVGDHPMACI